VHDEITLREAVKTMQEERVPEYDILIEPYINGPEVDVKIGLWDGELAWAEVCDDFPYAGDSEGA
jgi:hypothetical protein